MAQASIFSTGRTSSELAPAAFRFSRVSQNTFSRHTACTATLSAVPSSGITVGAIVDTPGIREFGLWDVHQDELAYLFPEMRPYLGSCRFGLDCRHDEEPGCEVRKAVMQGEISPYRWKSYLQLRYER